MLEAVQLCTEARDASPTRVAIMQERVRELFSTIFSELSRMDNSSAISAHIWEGADGGFVGACLEAQELPWPDARCRLRIAEDAVAMLDNCSEWSGLLAKGAVPRLCGGLVQLEGLLEDAEAPLASGVLESYQALARVLRKNSTSDEATLSAVAAAAGALGRLLRRRDLQDIGRNSCMDVLFQCMRLAAIPQAELPVIAQVASGIMKKSLNDASLYLRAHEVYSISVGDTAALAAMDEIRASRERMLKSG